MKILVVEDFEQDLEGFKSSVGRYNIQKTRDVEIVEAKTLDAAFSQLDNTFDAALIDMSLDDDANAGNAVIERINTNNIRIPIAILTGTPDNVHVLSENIVVYTKGEADHDAILDEFWGVHVSGITKIMGGRGTIETLLNNVYHQNILPQRKAWIDHGTNDSERSEKALLRHTLNHLIQLVDLDEEVCFPEEFYIYPAFDDTLRTGCIVRNIESGKYFVLLTPLCDLTPRSDLDGEYKASNLILASVDSIDEIYDRQHESKKGGGKRGRLNSSLKSNARLNFHALPATSKIEGGFINFEAIFSIPKGEIYEMFQPPYCQISPSFLKDIVARFSAYLGRQGQPEVHH